MADDQLIKIIDIWPGTNLWRAPNWFSCFGIQLEGPAPPPEERRRKEAIVKQRRNAWSPDVRAWQQLQEITNDLVRRSVIVKIWDAIIVALDESEGPWPIKAFCTGVETQSDDTGVLQAYLRLENPQAVPNESGSDTRRVHLTRTADGSQWINLGDLYEIQVLSSDS